MPGFPTFTDEEKKVLRRAADASWQYIAYDCIVGTAEAEGKDPDAVTLRKAEVIELALDADRPRQFILEETRSWPQDRRDDLLKRWNDASYAQMIRLVKPAFPYTRYGL